MTSIDDGRIRVCQIFFTRCLLEYVITLPKQTCMNVRQSFQFETSQVVPMDFKLINILNAYITVHVNENE